MAASNNILQRLPQAVQAWLKTLAPIGDVPAANIYCGISIGDAVESDDRERLAKLPRIVVYCQSAEHVTDQSQSWLADLTVTLRSNFDGVTSEADHNSRVAALIDAFFSTTICEDINTAAAAASPVVECALFRLIVRDQSVSLAERSFESVIGVQVHCWGQAYA